MKKIFILLTICTILACSKDDDLSNTFSDCEMQTENYKKYNDEEIGCQFFYTLTEYDDQFYIELSSYCADLTRPFVINENCEDICENEPYNPDSECGKYLNNREVIEIILIEK